VSFSARPDQPWGPPNHLYNGYRVLSGGIKYGQGVLLTTHPLLVLWKSRAIPLLSLWATTGPVTVSLYLFLPFTYSINACLTDHILVMNLWVL